MQTAFSEFPDQRLKGIIQKFSSKTKNNLRGIDISQPTLSMSLSVPLFSFDPSDFPDTVQCNLNLLVSDGSILTGEVNKVATIS